MNARVVYESLLKRYAELAYLEELRKLETIAHGDLWLVGGWVRCAFLGHVNYVGDIDCISSCTPEELSVLTASHVPRAVRNFSGGLRFPLPDLNHIDLSSTYTLSGDSSIARSLEGFNASVNAVAIRLRDGKVVAANGALEDLNSRHFRVLGQEFHEKGIVAVLSDIEALSKFYGLIPNNDSRTQAIVLRIARERTRLSQLGSEDALVSAVDAIRNLVPPRASAWLVRGFVRNALLRELSFWDDKDVVVDCEGQELIAHLSSNAFEYALNFHGNPKVCLGSGHMVDIWPIADTGLSDELERYEFNVDAVAWDVNKRCVVDPLNASRDLKLRRLRLCCPIDGSSQRSVAYAAVKAAYLCLRHKFLPQDDRTIELLRLEFPIDGLLRKNAHRLARELWCSNVPDICSRISWLRDFVGASPSVGLLLESAHHLP